MHKIVVFVPNEHVETVKEAMFSAGAGRHVGQEGSYQRCAWQTQGQGQFEPMPGSSPFCGEVGKLHTEPEWRVEMLCPDERLQGVVSALKAAHPYQEPAYDIWPLLEL